jgi:hypothetical protein
MKLEWFKMQIIIKNVIHLCGRNYNSRCRFPG